MGSDSTCAREQTTSKDEKVRIFQLSQSRACGKESRGGGKEQTVRTIAPVDELTIIMLGWAPPATISDPLLGLRHIVLSAVAPSLKWKRSKRLV